MCTAETAHAVPYMCKISTRGKPGNINAVTTDQHSSAPQRTETQCIGKPDRGEITRGDLSRTSRTSYEVGEETTIDSIGSKQSGTTKGESEAIPISMVATKHSIHKYKCKIMQIQTEM